MTKQKTDARKQNTVELRWLEHPGAPRNWFEIGLVRATEGSIMVPGQEANNDSLGNSFLVSTQYLYVVYTHKNRLDEAIIMSTHNQQFLDKIRIFP